MSKGNPRRDLLGLRHPFFRPVWVRVATVAVCCGWGVFEIVAGSPIWGFLFLAVGLYTGWAFFLSADKRYYEAPESGDEEK